MYFLQKEGVYSHGVFWIGSDVDEGKRQADRAASHDIDDYHEWVLYEYRQQGDGDFNDYDARHTEIYKTKKLTETKD